MVESHYADKSEPIIIDKSRSWAAPQTIETMIKLYGEVKIIATVRPIADCMASLVKIAKPDNVKEFCKSSQLAMHLIQSYHTLKAGYEAHPECFHFVEYNDLVENPKNVIDDLYEFLDIPYYYHHFTSIQKFKANGIQYDDNIYECDLHDVRKDIKKPEYKVSDILPENVIRKYGNMEFWRN